MAQKSLAYRNHEAKIWNGEVPEKYSRIIPFITGNTVLEIGSAEGVLALLLSDAGRNVIAVEKNQGRWEEAKRLRDRWRELGRDVSGAGLFNCDVREMKEPFRDIHTVVAVRSIYYLREDAQPVLNEIGKNRVPQVVLCGNRNRAAWNEAERAKNALGKWNYYASVEGMTELLTRAGYEIDVTVTEGDPIVVGRYPHKS